MPLHQVYAPYLNQMATSLLLGIKSPMALTVSDIFGDSVPSVTTIDFVRESFVAAGAAGTVNVSGDTGWWRLSNAAGHATESMFGLTSDAMPTVSTLRAIDKGVAMPNDVQGFTTNMSNLASGTVTLDDVTRPSWFFAAEDYNAGNEIFVISVLDPGVTSTAFLGQFSGLFNLARTVASDQVTLLLEPDTAANGHITLKTSGVAGNSASLVVSNADSSLFQWTSDGVSTSTFLMKNAHFNVLRADATPQIILSDPNSSGNQAFLVSDQRLQVNNPVLNTNPWLNCAWVSGAGSRFFVFGDPVAGTSKLAYNVDATNQGFHLGNEAFTANGTVAVTLTALGPTGSNTTVQEWLAIHKESGTVRYIPCY